MPVALAIDTATDACSVGLARNNDVLELHRELPRAHNKHLLAMIDELLDDTALDAVDHFVCGIGPGSFTGLRIAASVIQGLAWSLDKPVLAMCSLELQARSYVTHHAFQDGVLLSTIDAQIGQLYWRWFAIRSGQCSPLSEPHISSPEAIEPVSAGVASACIGSGAQYAAALPGACVDAATRLDEHARPHAGVLAAWANDPALAQGAVALAPADLIPRYVQQDIGWKKLSEQPRRV